jgi:hypothetical protein
MSTYRIDPAGVGFEIIETTLGSGDTIVAGFLTVRRRGVASPPYSPAHA